MNAKNILAIVMLVFLIVAVSSLVATIFALPFLIFLAIFILAFARPSKYDLNRIRAGLGLNENHAMILIVGIPLITYLVLSSLGIALILPGERIINPYDIYIQLSGNNTVSVSEVLTYHISGEELATEIGRYLNSEVKNLRIICPPGMVPFNYSFWKGKERIKAGCRNLEGHLKAGQYDLQLSYEVTPKFICDDEKCLGKMDLGYLELDAANVRVHSSEMKAWLGQPPYIKAEEDFTVYVLSPRYLVSGFEVGKITVPKNFATLIEGHVFLTGLAIVGASVVLVLIIYLVFGKEFSFKDVPRFLTRIPKRRKPYEVNLLFYGDPDKVEDGAIIATILDLARRGYLKLEEEKIKFTNKDPNKLDDYEGKVYWTLKKLAEETGSKKVLNLEKFRKIVQKTGDITWLTFIKDLLEELYVVENIPKAYDKTGRYLALIVFIGLGVVGVWFGTNMEYINYLWLGYALIASAVSGIIAILTFDVYALGRYLPGYARERCEWSSFRRTLNEYALVREHAKTPEELEEWLIYANALGVPNNVERVVEDSGGKLPNITPDYQLLAPSFLIEIIKARIEELRSGRR